MLHYIKKYKSITHVFKIFLLVFHALLIFVNSDMVYAQTPPDISKEESIYTTIYENITPSIVSIEANTREGISSGTGCIVDSSGLILTSLHVIKNAGSIEVTTNSGATYGASPYAILKNNEDLAIIKIEPREELKIVKFGDSENVKVGQRVLTIGNPFGFRGTLTTGIVSRIDYTRNKIQTDAAINPGCSGGPLLNTRGEVIGINQSIYNPDHNRSNIGIGFAIPINNAKSFVDATLKKTRMSLK